MGQKLLSHRVAWAIHHGEWPEVIDHINGDKRDNRISNLRDVDAWANSRNKPVQSKSKTGIVGVEIQRGKFRARGFNGKTIGMFDNIEDAAQARQEFQNLHGFHDNHGKRQPYRPPV